MTNPAGTGRPAPASLPRLNPLPPTRSASPSAIASKNRMCGIVGTRGWNRSNGGCGALEHVGNGLGDVGDFGEAAHAGVAAGEALLHGGDDAERFAALVNLREQSGVVEVAGNVSGPAIGGD